MLLLYNTKYNSFTSVLKSIYFYSIFIYSFFFSQSLLAQTKTWAQKDIFNAQCFIKNEGQCNGWSLLNEPVLYAIDNGLDQYQFSSTGFAARLDKVEKYEEDKYGTHEEHEEVDVEYFFVAATWEGANKNVWVEAVDIRSDYFTYVLYNTKTKSAEGLKANSCKKLIYHNLYDKIDLEYTFIPGKSGFKYSFILHPGAEADKIKLKYAGDDVKNVAKDEQGILVNLTEGLYIKESSLSVAYKKSNTVIPCEYKINNNIVSFFFPNGYNTNETVVIDPWLVNSLATLTTNSLGYDVGCDNAGNLYVFGGGGGFGDACKVSKYDNTGALQWTFNGTIAIPAWTSTPGMAISNFLVDPLLGKVYVGQSFPTAGGAETVRLNTAGLYDNFITTSHVDAVEIWDFLSDCNNGQVYMLGGSYSSNLNMGVINNTTGVVSSTNFTGHASFGQDLVNGAIDENGNIYVVVAVWLAYPNAAVDNHIYKLNSTLTGNLWNTPTGYLTLAELGNKPYPGGAFLTSNGYNCMAVNSNYLYFYDGSHIKAFNKNTGAPVGAAITIPGLIVKEQGGIYVDDCDNVYVGGVGEIKVYKFNGANFSYKGNISLGLNNAHVFDIRYLGTNQSLYVSGDDFVGTYSAIYTVTCTANISVTAVAECSGNAIATVVTQIQNPNLTYTWIDNTGQVVSTTANTSVLTNTVSGLSSGNTYTVQVQNNPLCGGSVTTCTVNVKSSAKAAFVATPQPTTILNTTINFTNTSVNATQYFWSLGDVGNTTSNSVHNTFKYPEVPGTYTVQLIADDQYGCKDTAVQIIIINDVGVVFIPNTFTPNGDGINEVFVPEYWAVPQTDFEFLVFDRWGNLIFKTNQLGAGWNGKINGRPAQQDTYVWRVQYINSDAQLIKEVGHVNLVR